MLAPTSLFGSSCGGGCTEPTGTDYYYIKYLLNGEDFDSKTVILNFGSPAVEPNDPSVVLSPSDDAISFTGQYCFHEEDPIDGSVLWYGWLHLATPGVYIGAYGDSDTPVGWFSSSSFLMKDGDGDYGYYVSDGTIIISSFGDVGGDVEGSFNLTIESIAPAPSYGSPLTATGQFRLLRIPDEYYEGEF